MSANKKPRKKYRPRWIPANNTLEIAKEGASVPSVADVTELMGAIKTCHKALREGVASVGQWSILAGSVALAKSIERQGKVRGLSEYLDSADKALLSVFQRSNAGSTWRQSPLHFYELDAIAAFMDMHSFQLRNLSRAEIEEAINKTQSRAISDQDLPAIVRDLERMAA